MKECVFCKIEKGELPCELLIESERVIAFLDVQPVNPGHSLVVTRAHVENLLEVSPCDLKEAVMTVQKVAHACMEATGASGCNVLQNNGRCAGQVIAHLHFHVIPRRPDDSFSFGWRHGRYEAGEMEDMRRKIIEKL